MEECLICYEEVKDENIIKTCNDKHIFCINCLDNWKKQFNNNEKVLCPLCRSVIERKNGLYVYYYKNNKVHIKCTYINDKLYDTYIEYYENGNLKKVCNYNNDLLNGLYKEYYESGNLKKICNYYNGELNGLYKEYIENDDKHILFLEIIYKNGIRNGLYKSYYIHNGNIETEAQYINGIIYGKCIKYYENNDIYIKCNYNSYGFLDGLYEEYNFYGNLRINCNYKNGFLDGVYQKYLFNILIYEFFYYNYYKNYPETYFEYFKRKILFTFIFIIDW